MRRTSKKFKRKKNAIEPLKLYTVHEALAHVLDASYEKFDPTIEVHIKTGVTPKKSDQVVRGSVVLPHGVGKTKRVAVFAEGDKAKEAREAGADSVGGQEFVQEIKTSGKADFDIAVATPDMMKHLSGIARILGPKGLMPSPKNETVTLNITQTVAELKRGKVHFKNDDTGNIHQAIGKKSFGAQKLLENYASFLEAIRKSKPASTKGVFIKIITLNSTMGPAVRVQSS